MKTKVYEFTFIPNLASRRGLIWAQSLEDACAQAKAARGPTETIGEVICEVGEPDDEGERPVIEEIEWVDSCELCEKPLFREEDRRVAQDADDAITLCEACFGKAKEGGALDETPEQSEP